MHVYFWQNMMSHHQSAVIEAINQQKSTCATWIVERKILNQRSDLGWSATYGDVEIVVGPSIHDTKQLLGTSAERSVHIFSGIHFEKTQRRAFYASLRHPVMRGILGEPPMPERSFSSIVPMIGRKHRFLFGKYVDFILAIGHMGVEAYKEWGYSDEKILPYGYFPAPSTVPDCSRKESDPFRLLYVGQLIPRKGGDVLLKALGQLKGFDWTLDVVGDGPERSGWNVIIENEGISNRIVFHEVKPSHEIQAVMNSCDLLILPSHHDGWGAVVNEALLQGTPVICSDRCGAADLLKDKWRGETFQCGQPDHLAEVLRHRIEQGKPSQGLRYRIVSWAAACIHPEVAARYVLDVIHYRTDGGVRPVAPWMI